MKMVLLPWVLLLIVGRIKHTLSQVTQYGECHGTANNGHCHAQVALSNEDISVGARLSEIHKDFATHKRIDKQGTVFVSAGDVIKTELYASRYEVDSIPAIKPSHDVGVSVKIPVFKNYDTEINVNADVSRNIETEKNTVGVGASIVRRMDNGLQVGFQARRAGRGMSFGFTIGADF